MRSASPRHRDRGTAPARARTGASRRGPGSGCSSSQRPAGADEHELRQRRSAASAAISAAIMPPIEWPTRCGRSRPRAVDDVPAVEREVEHVLEQVLAAVRRPVARPAPARTRGSAARARSRNGSSRKSPPAPCRKTSGAPLPASSTRTLVRRRVVSTLARLHQPRLRRRRPARRCSGCTRSASGLHPPAVVVLPLGPHVAELRHHPLGEELRRVARLLVGHVARCGTGRRRVPTRRPLIISSMRSRTVVGAARRSRSRPRPGPSR